MSTQIPRSCPQTAPPDPRLIETALACGAHREMLLEAIRTQDWSAIDSLPEPTGDGDPDWDWVDADERPSRAA